MRNPLKWLKDLFAPSEAEPLLTSEQSDELDAAVESLTQPAGRIVKVTKRPEFKPDAQRHGGRMVKAMPRELRQIKYAQEKVEHDTEM